MSSFDEDYTKVTDVHSTPLNHFWGDSSQMSLSSAGLLIGSGPKNNFNAMGIMQLPSGVSAGEGYGSFSFIARYEYGGQGGGDYLLLWRADNQWFPTSEPNIVGEADMLESWDNSKTEQSTLHFYQASASGGNGQSFHGTAGVDLTKLHVYTFDWHAGQLDFYIDTTKIYSTPSAQVPKDYAHGDCNYCMGGGAQTETAPVGMYITTAKYVAEADMAAQGGIAGILAGLVARAGGTSTATSGSTTTTSTGSPTTAPAEPGISYTISSPGTVTGTAPVTVKLAATGPAGSSAVAFVIGPEPGYSWLTQIPVTFDATGKATVTASLSNGEEVKLMSDTSGANAVDSGAITITSPTSGIASSSGSSGSGSSGSPVTAPATPASPGTAQLVVLTASASVGGNVSFTWTKATGSNQTVKANVNGQYVGTIEDGAPDGGPWLKTVTPSSKAPVIAGANEIDLYIEGGASSAKLSFTAGGGTTTTTASSAYSWATLSTAVIAAMGSSGSSASILATIVADFEKFQTANPGK